MDYYYDEPQEPEEAIYNWIKEEVRVPPKPKRYRSKHSGKTTVSGSTLRVKKASAATFGRPSERSRPDDYLKAGSKMGKGTASLGGRPRGFRSTKARRKEAVPSREERPVYGLKTSKNFVVSNAVENILAAPKMVTGNKLDYRKKQDYGKVPQYLSEVKAQIEEERAMIQDMIAAQDEYDGGVYDTVTELSEGERTELVKALKAKWDAVNAQYQLMTFKRVSSSNSTVGAIRRKEECERQLAQLEKDIERLSGKGPVLVVEE